MDVNPTPNPTPAAYNDNVTNTTQSETRPVAAKLT